MEFLPPTSIEPAHADPFPLTAGTIEGTKWTLGPARLFADGQAIGTTFLVSFDTGNGVPWIHNAGTNSIPQAHGLVKPSTRIGVGPPGSAREAVSVVAGTSFANKIKVVDLPGGSPLVNVSIQAFFDHIVAYDNVRGVISFAPAVVTAAPTR
jgi:hypothetical protein